MRSEIEALCLQYLKRPPELDNPKGYNDKIQWLKLYDQRRDQITACDKWAVREWIPAKHLIPAELGVSRKWPERVLKCNHDSGSSIAIDHDGAEANALAMLQPRQARPYGIGKGEWAYRFIKPQIMTERRLAANITDYKFHCVHGKTRWVQVIGDRASGRTRETILDADGEVMPLHFDEKMMHCPDPAAYPGAKAWGALSELATLLAQGWRYVRVDLYWTAGKAWFGELTFWPRAGCYRSADEPIFGEMLDIDLSEKMAPIC